jgi:glutamine amidotransferase
MARLVGFIANRPDLCNRFAQHEADALRCSQPPMSGGEEQPWGWGVGFFQTGEVLLKRRPIDDRAELSVDEMIADVRSDVLIAHVRRATVGTLRTDNTHPFRYRHWMFADTGTVDGFGELRTKLYDSLPQFLRRSLRGDTDSELLFHLFLSFLHDAGQLEQPMVPSEHVFAALKSSLGLLDRLGRDAGVGASKLNILVATPDYLVAAHRGAPMGYRVLAGREDFEALFGDEGPGRLRMPDLQPCRLCVVASDFDGDLPDGWTALPDRAMAAFTRTDDPHVVQAK